MRVQHETEVYLIIGLEIFGENERTPEQRTYLIVAAIDISPGGVACNWCRG